MNIVDLAWWTMGTQHRTKKIEPITDNEHYLHGYAIQAKIINDSK